MARPKLTPEQKTAKAAARAEALAAREARRIAAGRAKPQTTGDVLQRLRGGLLEPSPTPPDHVENGEGAQEGPRGWLVSRRAAAKESAHAAMQRIHEAGRRRERAQRDAEARIDALSATEKVELLEQLRRGVYPEWAPHIINPDNINLE